MLAVPAQAGGVIQHSIPHRQSPGYDENRRPAARLIPTERITGKRAVLADPHSTPESTMACSVYGRHASCAAGADQTVTQIARAIKTKAQQRDLEVAWVGQVPMNKARLMGTFSLE